MPTAPITTPLICLKHFFNEQVLKAKHPTKALLNAINSFKNQVGFYTFAKCTLYHFYTNHVKIVRSNALLMLLINHFHIKFFSPAPFVSQLESYFF